MRASIPSCLICGSPPHTLTSGVSQPDAFNFTSALRCLSPFARRMAGVSKLIDEEGLVLEQFGLVLERFDLSPRDWKRWRPYGFMIHAACYELMREQFDSYNWTNQLLFEAFCGMVTSEGGWRGISYRGAKLYNGVEIWSKDKQWTLALPTKTPPIRKLVHGKIQGGNQDPSSVYSSSSMGILDSLPSEILLSILFETDVTSLASLINTCRALRCFILSSQSICRYICVMRGWPPAQYPLDTDWRRYFLDCISEQYRDRMRNRTRVVKILEEVKGCVEELMKIPKNEWTYQWPLTEEMLEIIAKTSVNMSETN